MTVHRLFGTNGNIHHSWDASLEPRLVIDHGDEVVIGTRSGEDDQLRPGDGAAAIGRLEWERLHALTGPIAVQGATKGSTLVVRVLDLTPADWGFVMQRPGAGLLRGFDDYLRFFDIRGGMATTAGWPAVPVRPFLGVMGVAPAEGRASTRPPGDHGGNLDCASLVEGTTLLLPVFHDGALFSCGDGHAAQGDGEVCVTAIECAMTARLGFEVDHDMKLRVPRAVTPTAYASMGSGTTMEDAARDALEDMLMFIGDRTGMDRSDAYALASIAVDLRVNQVVNEPVMGVRAELPREILDQ